MKFLVDPNVYRYPAVSTYHHADDRFIIWGNLLIGLREYYFGYSPPRSKIIAKEIPFVPALATTARQFDVEFFTYELLELERFQVRPAVDWARRSIRDLFTLNRISGVYPIDGIVIGGGSTMRASLQSPSGDFMRDYRVFVT